MISHTAGNDTELYVMRMLAQFYYERGELDKAASFYSKALAVCRGKPLEAAAVMVDMANVYIDQKKYAKAESLFPRILNITVQSTLKLEIGMTSSKTNITYALYEMSRTCKRWGRVVLANKLYLRALAIERSRFGIEFQQRKRSTK
jgi:tetratricopeptide (TPR) repeat protein